MILSRLFSARTDIDFEKVELISGPRLGSYVGNSSSESQSPGLSGSSNGAVGISESSTLTIPTSECKNGAINKALTCELHGGFRSKCGCQTPAEDLASLELRKFDDFDNDDKSFLEASKIGAVREKRLRKPTRRYIEEVSNKKPKCLKGREKYLAAATKDTILKVRSHSELHNVRRRALTVVHGEKPLRVTSIQSVSEVRARRGRPKKQAIKQAPILVRKS